jgi:hypothetical protein
MSKEQDVPMTPLLIDVTIQGVTPLLCNKFGDESEQKIESGGGSTFTGDPGSPREQAERKLYVGLAGKPIIPQPNLFRCIIDAGIFFKIGQSKVTTQKSSLIPACVEIDGVELPLESREGWQVDSRAIRNPVTGGRRLCHRPVFNDWRISCTIILDRSMMSAKMLREVVDAAGKKIGLGDFRPSRKGPFGKFVVVSWTEQASKVAA